MTGFLLHHLLSESAARQPSATALVMEQRCLTYGQLESRSTLCSQKLLACGFTAAHPVGLYAPKSIEAITAIYGILKAGGYYIPLDTLYSPVERIVQIICHSRMEFLLTTKQVWHGFYSSLTETQRQSLPLRQIIVIDSLIDDCGNDTNGDVAPPDTDRLTFHGFSAQDAPEPFVQQPIAANALAYVLYTSGSTGAAKGVMISHANSLSFIRWALNNFTPGQTDRFSSVAPLQFDLSVFDIFVSCGCGASLHLVAPERAANPRSVLQWIEEQGITIFYSVPSLWITILNYANLPQSALPTLRFILFAGEVFAPSYLTCLMQRLPHAVFYNLYGPTETNVCTAYRLTCETALDDKPAPIGSVCSNAEALVLTDCGTEASVGQEGELLIRGETVFQGYLNDREKTQAAFIQSPLEGHQGVRFYRTGDIVTRIDSTNLRFVGRKDTMVKWNGFRIELTEIELALMKHPDIAEAIAVMAHREGSDGQCGIVVFVTVRNHREPTIVELKLFCAIHLPRYMIPGAIEILSVMPKNANGKTDRQALTQFYSKKTEER